MPLLGEPKDSRGLRLAADIQTEAARLAKDLRDPPRAQKAAEQAMRFAQLLVALDPSSIESRDYLSQAQSSLGTAYRAGNQLELAASNYRAAVEIREQLVRERPGNVGYRRNLMVGYGHIGDALGLPRSGGLGELAGAAEALRKAVEIAEWLCQSDPSDRTARFDLLNARYRLGAVLLPQPGRATEALAVLQSAETLVTDLQKEDPGNLRYRAAALYTVRKAAEALAASGRDAEAARRFAAVRSLAETFRGTHQEEEARFGHLAATVELAKLKARARNQSALPLADESVAYLAKVTVTSSIAWGLAVIYSDLAAVYRQFHQPAQSQACLERSAELWREMKLPAALESERTKELSSLLKFSAVPSIQ